MRQLKIDAVRRFISGLRRELPSVAITRRRAGAGAGVVALLGGAAYALRAKRASRVR